MNVRGLTFFSFLTKTTLLYLLNREIENFPQDIAEDLSIIKHFLGRNTLFHEH